MQDLEQLLGSDKSKEKEPEKPNFAVPPGPVLGMEMESKSTREKVEGALKDVVTPNPSIKLNIDKTSSDGVSTKPKIKLNIKPKN